MVLFSSAIAIIVGYVFSVQPDARSFVDYFFALSFASTFTSGSCKKSEIAISGNVDLLFM